MQLNLIFLEIPSHTTPVWENLDDEQRDAALEVLAKLIAQAAQQQQNEGSDYNG